MANLYVNPDCVYGRRCGNCHSDVLVLAQINNRLAKAKNKELDAGHRYCVECQQVKTVRDFGSAEFRMRCLNCARFIKRTRERERDKRNREHSQRLRKKHPCLAGCGAEVHRNNTKCWKCYSISRLSSVSTKLVTNTCGSSGYPCLNGCGKILNKNNDYCFDCKQDRKKRMAGNSEVRVRDKRVMESLEKGTAHGVMWVGEEAYSLQWKCIGTKRNGERCNKPLLIQGRCFECATNRPKTLTVQPRVLLKSGTTS